MTVEFMLTPRQKAAVIVGLVVSEGGNIPLDSLPEPAQEALAREMAQLGLIDRKTRDQIVSEFCDDLERVGLSFPTGIDGALDILGESLSRDTVDRLRRIAAMSGGDPWERICALPISHICDLALSEATEVAAVMFSKLPTAKAAEAFGQLPNDRARQIAYAMSMTGSIQASALRRIGLALIHATDGLARPAIEGKPVEKVGAILNFTPAATRDQVLAGLDKDDQDFADNVRKAIFTWANIPDRIDPRDIPRITREVDGTTLIKALAGARDHDRATVDFIFSALSSRLADSLREEITAVGKVSAKDAEGAMAEVVAAIRRMEQTGDLFMIVPEGDE